MNAAGYVRIIGINELIYHSPFHFSGVQGDRRVGLHKIPHRASHCPAAATRDAGAADGEQPGLGEEGRDYLAGRRGGRKMGGFFLSVLRREDLFLHSPPASLNHQGLEYVLWSLTTAK